MNLPESHFFPFSMEVRPSSHWGSFIGVVDGAFNILEICSFGLFIIFLSGFARTSIGHDPILHSARRSALYMTQTESTFGLCFVLVCILNKFLSFIVLLIVTSVCLFH